LSLALVGAAAFVVPGSAWATTGHTFAGQFGGLGTGDGQFSDRLPGAGDVGAGPAGVGVLASTGEVFTVDAGITDAAATPRVQRFSADGVFQSAFALDPAYAYPGATALDPSGFGAVYMTMFRISDGASAVLKYSAAGVFAYELDASGSQTTINNPTNGAVALAVDPVDGTVYVTATHEDGRQVIDRFDGTTGAFIDFFDGSTGSDSGFSCPPLSLVVDGSHRVYVLDPCKNGTGRVDQYSPAGVWGATVDDGSRGAPSAVAADPVSDEVYVSEAGPVGLQVTHFSAGGAAPVYTFDASNVDGVRAMAVSGVGTVYTSEATEPFVQRFTRFDGPTVTTDPADPINARDATLNGTIDPEGVDSTYHFEYGLDQTYGSRTVGNVPAGSGSDPIAASALVSGLKPNTTYHYRIVGTNASGSIKGPDLSFTTATAPATLDGSPPFASAITPRSARINGTINPNSNGFVGWRFEYGTTTAYGSTATPEGDLGFCFGALCGGADRPVVAQLSNLEPGTLYHFRVVAYLDGVGGTQQGVDQTFITAPAAGGGASDVTTKRATLTGTINPHGQETTYRFNYGLTSSYGAITPEVDAGDGDGDQQVSHQVSGLLPDTTYHVQVVATSDDGVIRYGADGLFRTAPAPDAVAISPIGVSTGSATLVGEANTYGLPGTYRFDVSSLDSSYSSSTAERPVSGHASAEQVSVPVDGLPAGETFVVQMSVTSNDTTRFSDLVTFKTASVPQVFPPPPSGDGPSSYGCAAPRLDSYDSKPKPGDTVTVSGRDLGASGTVVLGDRSLVPADWSTGGFKFKIPEDATGTLALTVNCGQRSNTVAITIFKRPSSRFSIANTSVDGSKATLSVKVPGPGTLTSSAAKAKPGKVTIKKARGAKLVVRLNRAGIRALRKSKSGRLKVTARVRFTPAGGKPATKTISLTFKKAGR